PGGVQLVDRLLGGAVAGAVLVADVVVDGGRPGGEGREHRPFEHLVRVLLHQDAVIEGAGFALVGVQAEVDRAGVVFGQEGPLQAGREAGAAAAAQARRLHDVHGLGGLHLLDDALKGAVAAVGPVAVERVTVGLGDASEQDRLVVGHEYLPQCSRATTWPTFSRLTFITCSSLTMSAGAPSQAPMHSATSRVIFLSAVVPPGFTFSSSHRWCSTESQPWSMHARP